MRRLLILSVLGWLALTGRAEAQLGNLISPGRLSRAHAELEGLPNCQRCHTQGQKVTADKCLSCHAPVRERIAARTGVHRTVKDDCVSCHVEHAGVDGELRPFDTSRFDHARETGFPLNDKHAATAGTCSACHKSRSFLSAKPGCGSCHADVHKGRLGATCASCHSASVAFKELGGRFDHAASRFPLTGAHRTATCTACHKDQLFKGVQFGSCTDCHKSPHREPPAGTCQSCHTTANWRATKFDHTRTAYPLLGRHAQASCAGCHKQPALRVKPRSDTCAACHADVHRGTFKQDCKACHSENGFGKAPFDHATTAFKLTGRHAAITCDDCHKRAAPPTAPAGRGQPAGRVAPARGAPAGGAAAVRLVADFKGLKTECASCHRDVHGGELGAACATCHSTVDFQVGTYTHKRSAELFGGLHAPLACERCHARAAPRPPRAGATPVVARFATTPTACAGCHDDVHLGQFASTSCGACHNVGSAKFAATGFAHAKTSFALTGKHETTPCAGCHTRATGAFPAKSGTAVRYASVATTCSACHKDVHLGQIAAPCESCHVTSSFHLTRYRHQSNPLIASGFFSGRHAVACQSCHKTLAARFPAGQGTAVQFAIDPKCVSCHRDVHFGSLGPRCGDCHKP